MSRVVLFAPSAFSFSVMVAIGIMSPDIMLIVLAGYVLHLAEGAIELLLEGKK